MSDSNNGNGKSLVPDSLKKELEEVQKATEGRFTPPEDEAGDITVDIEEKKQDTPEEKPEDTTPDPKKEDEDDPADEPEDVPDDEEEEGADEDDDDSDEDDSDDDKDTLRRKVIPIKRLHDETRKRKAIETEKKALEQRVAELEKISNNTTQGSKKESEALKAWADKHGYSEEGMEDLVNIIRSGVELDQESILKKTFGDGIDALTIQKAVQSAKKQEEKEQFDKEYKEVEPSIKQQFPNATPEQITSIRSKLDELSHTEWGHDKDLDYILFKKKSVIDKVLGKETTPASKKKAGPEGGRMGAGKYKEVSAKDFIGKNPKDFSELSNLPDADREKIVKEFDPETKIKYWKSLGSGTGDVIKRGGKTIARF